MALKKADKQADQEEDIHFKTLLFQMYQAGFTQEAMAKYLGRGKQTINALLKPLQKKGD